MSPTHLRELRRNSGPDDDVEALASASERRRRIRDAVEAALSDVILLGTEEQVRLAARAADDMIAGQNVETAALVVSLRDFIRKALDLTPIPAGVRVPDQGPLRVNVAGGGRRGAEARGGPSGGSGGPGGGRGGGGGAAGGGAGMGLGIGIGGVGGGAAAAGSSQESETP